MKKIRLPVAFLIVPSIFFGMFAIIAGGVAVSQGPNAEWTICLVLTACLAVCGLLYKFAPVDWISDEELTKREHAEAVEARYEEVKREIEDGTFAAKSKRRYYGYVATGVALLAAEPVLKRGFTDDRDGMGIYGLKLGVWHVLGRDWTGFELLLVTALLIWLGWILFHGFIRLLNAQK